MPGTESKGMIEIRVKLEESSFSIFQCCLSKTSTKTLQMNSTICADMRKPLITTLQFRGTALIIFLITVTRIACQLPENFLSCHRCLLSTAVFQMNRIVALPMKN